MRHEHWFDHGSGPQRGSSGRRRADGGRWGPRRWPPGPPGGPGAWRPGREGGWPDAEVWRGKGDGAAWARFGRRMARLGVALLLLLLFLPLALGVVLAVTVGGWTSVIVAAVSWIGIAMVITLVVRTMFRVWWPIGSLIQTAGRLADGDYTARATTARSAPLRPVVRSFNRMAERLEDAEEQRRRLLADVGHELRTPLTIVRGELEAMADGVHEPTPEELHRLLGDLALMERLLDDLATLSRAEAGVLNIDLEPTDVVTLVHESVERLSSDAAAAGVDLTVVSASHPAGTDTSWADADVDPGRIREVVSNLVANAIRACVPGDRVTVTVAPAFSLTRHVSSDDASDDHASSGAESDDETAPDAVVITVADTGGGIEPERLGQVFDRFHRGTESGGSGLGLTISRNLVEAHGGTIGIESDVGAGTTVEVRLPRQPTG
ncbi:MAG: HAMP domain-containing sensor histidine kinase [Actinomycetota bacterium]